MSAALGLWLICRVGKFIIDSVLHAYSLHNMYGWSWRLLALFWDAITYLLLRRGDRNQPVTPATQNSPQPHYQLIYSNIEAIRAAESEINQARVSQTTPETPQNPPQPIYHQMYPIAEAIRAPEQEIQQARTLQKPPTISTDNHSTTYNVV